MYWKVLRAFVTKSNRMFIFRVRGKNILIFLLLVFLFFKWIFFKFIRRNALAVLSHQMKVFAKSVKMMLKSTTTCILVLFIYWRLYLISYLSTNRSWNRATISHRLHFRSSSKNFKIKIAFFNIHYFVYLKSLVSSLPIALYWMYNGIYN